MTVKIKELSIKKDEFTKSKNDNGWGLAGISKLDGKIKVELSEGIVTGSGEVDVYNVSEKLRNKLYDVLSEIEAELGGIKLYTDAYSWDSAISGGAINTSNKINTGGLSATLHNGEKVLTSDDDVGNIHIKGNAQLSDAKVKQPEETKSHNTDKDENMNVNYVLDEISKIFNSTFTIKNESDIGMVAKELAKKMKDTKGKL